MLRAMIQLARLGRSEGPEGLTPSMAMLRELAEFPKEGETVYVLERVGSDRAKKVLGRLAAGSPRATLTRRAIEALDRLAARAR